MGRCATRFLQPCTPSTHTSARTVARGQPFPARRRGWRGAAGLVANEAASGQETDAHGPCSPRPTACSTTHASWCCRGTRGQPTRRAAGPECPHKLARTARVWTRVWTARHQRPRWRHTMRCWLRCRPYCHACLHVVRVPVPCQLPRWRAGCPAQPPGSAAADLLLDSSSDPCVLARGRRQPASYQQALAAHEAAPLPIMQIGAQ
jgi:hypothetical protein